MDAFQQIPRNVLRTPGNLRQEQCWPRIEQFKDDRLAAHLKLQPDLWAEYASREVTRWEHLAELYRYLELSPFNRAQQKTCIRHLYPHAMRTDRGFLLAEEMLSWLHNNKGYFPLC